jgi:putative tricarboxylic transport membrane protein
MRIGPCVALLFAFAMALPVAAAPLDKPQCVAPAKPGGGFDVTCRLVQKMLAEADVAAGPVEVSYMPGGIGAVAYNVIVAKRPAEEGTIVAFSSGSLLNLAQGKFGRYTEDDVRWVASIAADYGAIVVPQASTIRTLRDLQALLRREPGKVVFGGGGAVGSQDWMKAAVTVRALGMDFKRIRFVAFEGGGEAIKALRGGHIHVFAGDAAETLQQMEDGGGIRIIAVLAPERLAGKLRPIPTAREQGFDIHWQIVRGVYVGPKVRDADYQAWVEAFRKAIARPGYAQMLEQRGLSPFPLTGSQLQSHVKSSVAEYRRLATEFGLQVPARP